MREPFGFFVHWLDMEKETPASNTSSHLDCPRRLLTDRNYLREEITSPYLRTAKVTARLNPNFPSDTTLQKDTIIGETTSGLER